MLPISLSGETPHMGKHRRAGRGAGCTGPRFGEYKNLIAERPPRSPCDRSRGPLESWLSGPTPHFGAPAGRPCSSACHELTTPHFLSLHLSRPARRNSRASCGCVRGGPTTPPSLYLSPPGRKPGHGSKGKQLPSISDWEVLLIYRFRVLFTGMYRNEY